jgi:peptidoglycan/xylan/chitin deacetylase (PgdA/CDA1 family)
MGVAANQNPNAVAQRIVMAPGQVADGLVLETSTGEDVFRVTADGAIFAKGLGVPADYVVLLDGSTFKAFNSRTGALLTSSATYATVYAAALAGLTSGNGVIIDMTDGMGPGPTTNRYEGGKLYDASLILSSGPAYHPLSVLSVFDEGYASWVKVGTGTATIADDTSKFIAGQKSVRVTTLTDGSSTFFAKALGYTLNLRDHALFHYRLRVYWHTHTLAIANGGAVFLVFYNTGNTEYTRVWLNPNTRLMDEPAETGAWVTYDLNWSDCGGTANFNDTAVTSIGIGIYAPSGTAHSVTFDETSVFVQQNPCGVVIFTFDDHDSGWTSTAKPVLDKYGWHAMCGWVPGLYPTESDEMQNLVRNGGWEMMAHSMTHPTWTGQSVANALTEFIVNLRWLAHYGLLPKTRVQVTPGGVNNKAIMDAFAPYFHFGRLGACGTQYNHFYWPPTNVHAMQCYEAGVVTRATAEAKVLAASTNKQVLILLWHSIGTGDWTLSEFDAFCAYIKSLGLDVLTLGELAAKYPPSNSPQPVVVID